jgi:hypothetical protein
LGHSKRWRMSRNTGVSPIEAHNEILKDDSDDNFGVEYSCLARLMSRTSVRLVSNEDGSPRTPVNFDGIRGVGTGNDDVDSEHQTTA